MHSALPAWLLDDTHAYIVTDCEGANLVSVLGAVGNVSHVAVDFGRQLTC